MRHSLFLNLNISVQRSDFGLVKNILLNRNLKERAAEASLDHMHEVDPRL